MTRTNIGPQTEAADQLHAMKYRGRGEDFEESVNRFAFGLADNGGHYHALRDVLLPQRFVPGGRVQGSIGAQRQTTAFNCYVSGTIMDSLVDGDGSIMQRLAESAATSRLGGGIGYDFSTLRPRGDVIKRIDSDATGPVSFMEYFNSVGLGVHSSGHRRGAQMAILRVDHPDIEEFVAAKQWTRAQNAIWRATEGLGTKARADVFAALQDFNPLQGFNISVGVTDAFMEAVYADGLFPLSFGGTQYREVRAVDLWQKIMRATWDWAEPGVLFVDTVNRMNNLWYCETIAATNPCGEQPLPPYGACLLGSFNLVKYLVKQGAVYSLDYAQLTADIPAIVRGMDNVNDRTNYPLPMQEADAKAKRRMGLGVMGLANAGEALGHVYGSQEFLSFEAQVMELIMVETYRASAHLAAEKGSFPLYDQERYLGGQFVQSLPGDVYDLIQHCGIRNSHLTSVAPTGTISMCADNVSSGIEPVFAYDTERPINTPNGRVVTRIGDYGADFLGVRGKLSEDVTAAEHVAVLLTAQRFVDSAVSKTCNVTGDTPWEDFTGIYSAVHAGGGKGCTTFNKDGKRMALLKASPGSVAAPEQDDGPSCAVDENGVRSCE